jgi:hypothetical protein
MGSTGDKRLNSIRTNTKGLVEGALANCPRVGVEVSEILFLDSTHGLGLTTNASDQRLAANNLNRLQDAIASLLQRLVWHAWIQHPRTMPVHGASQMHS